MVNSVKVWTHSMIYRALESLGYPSESSSRRRLFISMIPGRVVSSAAVVALLFAPETASYVLRNSLQHRMGSSMPAKAVP
jgi:hypothetical protein